MYLCYIDESGTPDVPGNTSHFVVSGLAIPIWHWKDSDREIARIKKRYSLDDAEIHTGWLLRKYPEQARIPAFESLNSADRRSAVDKARRAEILRLQKAKNPTLLKQTKKNYKHSENYIHLTFSERQAFVHDIAACVASWGFARLFAECIDKIHFDPVKARRTVEEQAFEQVVSRFEWYLKSVTARQARTNPSVRKQLGVLIHDNNPTVAKRHTDLMRSFHRAGTLWNRIDHIIETPLFVDSQLTSMVQVADLCAYALRRFVENEESGLFDLVFQRAHRRAKTTVGVRHFTSNSCSCQICAGHQTSKVDAIKPNDECSPSDFEN